MKKMIYVLALLILLLLPARPAFAQEGPLVGQVIFGRNFTLKDGQTMLGDLVVVGGTATIEEGAVVQGSVVIIGGTLKLDGETTRDIVLIGGQADLGSTAHIGGDLVPVGSLLERAEKARIDGNVITNLPPPQIEIPNQPDATNPPAPPQPPAFEINFDPFFGLVNIFFRAFGVAALAMLVSLFLQPQMDRVARTIVGQPFLAASVGLLTIPLALAGMLLLTLTLLLFPVAVVAGVVLVLACIFGIIALGQEVGERFAQATHQTWTPVLTAGIGSFLLMLAVGVVGLVPCVGGLITLLLTFVGLGGVMMAVLSSRNLFRPALAAPDGSEGPPPAAA